MRTALIGATGFVGSNLAAQTTFTDAFHRTDIDSMGGRPYDLAVCAGAPAAKWIANADPEADRRNIRSLIDAVDRAVAREFVLVSTVDVYEHAVGVTEASDVGQPSPYGEHRHELESFVAERFADHCIVRLPGLFGPGLRKNVLFDLLTGNQVDQIDPAGVFQWYDVRLLWRDIDVARAAQLRLLNLATEPLPTEEVLARFFPDARVGPPSDRAGRYDVRSVHAERFGGSDGYCYRRDDVLERLDAFIRGVREGSLACGSPYPT